MQNNLLSIFYQSIFEKSDLAIFIFQVIEEYENYNNVHYNFRFIITNDTHQKLTGISLPEIQNKFLMDLKNIIPEDNLLSIQKKYESCVRSKSIIDYEEEILIKNTPTYWYTKLIPIIENEKVIYIIGMSIDISKIKRIQKSLTESKNLLDNLLENSPVGIAVTDKNIHIVYYNTNFLKIWNLNKEILEKDKRVFFRMIKQIKNRKNVYKKIRMAIQKRKKTTIKYLRLNKRFIQMEIIPLYYNNEENNNVFYGYLGIYMDQTREVLQERKILKSLKEAQLANKSKSEFLTSISHELRTPLTTIIGLTDLLKNLNKDQQQIKYIYMIEESANYLLNLIQDILDISTLELKTLQLENKPFLLFKPIELLINTYKLHCFGKNLNFEFKTNINNNIIVVGDEKRLYQIINNLLSNALKFTKEGTIYLRVFKQYEDENEISILIEVEDTGMGIPEDKIPIIFEKFKKIEENNINSKGIGIGLSIVKDFIQLMNGKIEVSSKLGKGSIFKIYLNFKKSRTLFENQIEQMDLKDILDNYKPLIENKRILIAEDTLEIQFLLKKILSELPIEVDIVSNGMEVLQKIREKEYHLIILDIRMPIMDGITTFQKIDDGIKKRTPIVALTAYALKEDEIKAKELGFKDYLIKPFSKNQLLTKIIKLLINP